MGRRKFKTPPPWHIPQDEWIEANRWARRYVLESVFSADSTACGASDMVNDIIKRPKLSAVVPDRRSALVWRHIHNLIEQRIIETCKGPVRSWAYLRPVNALDRIVYALGEEHDHGPHYADVQPQQDGGLPGPA